MPVRSSPLFCRTYFYKRRIESVYQPNDFKMDGKGRDCMTFDEVIRCRRSIRAYEPTPVSKDLIEQVLEAGRLAPSASNGQNWHFTAVLNSELRHRLMEACSNQKQVEEAPVTLVIWATSDRKMRCGQSVASVDCSIATTFMMLKAADLGLGTCWLGAFDADLVKRILSLEDSATVVAVTPLGYPAESPQARPRKSLEEITDIRE